MAESNGSAHRANPRLAARHNGRGWIEQEEAEIQAAVRKLVRRAQDLAVARLHVELEAADGQAEEEPT